MFGVVLEDARSARPPAFGEITAGVIVVVHVLSDTLIVVSTEVSSGASTLVLLPASAEAAVLVEAPLAVTVASSATSEPSVSPVVSVIVST